MGGGKAHIKMVVVLALSMACLMPLVLVSAQGPAPSPKLSTNPTADGDEDGAADENTAPCWSKIMNCWKQNLNSTSLLEVTNPSFDIGKTLCCLVLVEQVKNEKDCFCSIAPFLPDDPRVAPNLDIVLPACKISGTIESICEVFSGGRTVGPVTGLVLLLAGLMFL